MFCRHVFGFISGGFHGISHFWGNFAGFCGNIWISRVRDRAKYQKPWLLSASGKGVMIISAPFSRKSHINFFHHFLKSRFFFCNGSKTDTLKRLMYRFIIGLFLKLRKSTFQQKKNYGVLMKPSELFVLKDTVIFLAL